MRPRDPDEPLHRLPNEDPRDHSSSSPSSQLSKRDGRGPDLPKARHPGANLGTSATALGPGLLSHCPGGGWSSACVQEASSLGSPTGGGADMLADLQERGTWKNFRLGDPVDSFTIFSSSV